MKRANSPTICPVCQSYIYENSHIHCMFGETRESLKQKISSIPSLDLYLFQQIYSAIIPPRESNDQSYNTYWNIIWENEYLSPIVPSWNLLQYLSRIIKDNKVLEVESGPGMISSLLQKMGCHIICTDSYQKMENNLKYRQRKIISPYDPNDINSLIQIPTDKLFTYTFVEKKTPNFALEEYGSKCSILLSIWNDQFPKIEHLKKFTGNTIILIGDFTSQKHYGGCFYPMCSKKKNSILHQDWHIEKEISLFSWFGFQEKCIIIKKYEK